MIGPLPISDLKNRLESVQARIDQAARSSARRAARTSHGVTVVAVTKTHSVEIIRQALSLGLMHLGENYVQEALAKKRVLRAEKNAIWHFIGNLQSNKVKSVVGEFDYIHSVDSERLALAIDARAQTLGRVQKILIQVNLDAEPSKGGVEPGHLSDLLHLVMPLRHLSVEGLMSVPKPSEDGALLRQRFGELRRLQEKMKLEGFALNELSMGMSSDFELAIEEGATFVRLGTILFGARASRSERG